MSKRRPRFTDEERVRIMNAKVALAIELDEWMNAGAPAAKVVDAVEELMLAGRAGSDGASTSERR